MAEKKEEENKNREALLLERKKIIFNLVLFSTAAVVVLIGVLTMAWFANNKKSSGTSMSVTVGNIPFELKTEGYYGHYDDSLPSEYQKVDKNVNGSQSMSTVNGSMIQWLVNADHHMYNYVTDETDSGDKGIRPGTSGEMKFWIVPKESRTVKVRFALELNPYLTNYVLDSEGNITVDENGEPVEASPLPIANLTDYEDTMNFIKSHIMFFRSRTPVMKADGQTIDHYTYSGMIDFDSEFNLIYINGAYTDTLTFDMQGTEMQEKEFSIYWVWPETLAEALLPEEKQNSGEHAICTGNEVFNRFKSDPMHYLKGFVPSDAGVSNNDDLTQESIVQNYSKLCIEYNNADQDIGDKIGYIMIILSAIG